MYLGVDIFLLLFLFSAELLHSYKILLGLEWYGQIYIGISHSRASEQIYSFQKNYIAKKQQLHKSPTIHVYKRFRFYYHEYLSQILTTFTSF